MSRKAPSSLNQLQHMLVATDDFKNPSDDEVSVAASVLKKWPLFSVDIYRDRHGDLANYTDDQLIEHFARFGIWENRTYSTIPHIARMIAKIDVSRSIEEKLQIRRPTHVPTVTVLVSSCGNAFMSEIAEEIAEQLKSIGGIVRMRDDSADPSAIDGIPLVVAPNEVPEILGEDEVSGFIYVLRSLSDDPQIAGMKDLHKIGFTRGTVEARIKNAEKSPTYLMAPVQVVATYRVYNARPSALENLIHRVFAEARLEVSQIDRWGRAYDATEWFVVPRDVINQAAVLIVSGEIVRYAYDVASGSLRLR